MWERLADALQSIPEGDEVTIADVQAFEPNINRNYLAGAMLLAVGLGLFEQQPPPQGFGVSVLYIRTDKMLVSSSSFAGGV